MKRTTILRTTGLILLGAAAVTAIGALILRDQMERHQRDLFSASPLKRLAALGYIGSLAATVELARTLRDFIAWEERSRLRRRATLILDRMEGDLEREAKAAATAERGGPRAGAGTGRGVGPRSATFRPGVAG